MGRAPPVPLVGRRDLITPNPSVRKVGRGVPTAPAGRHCEKRRGGDTAPYLRLGGGGEPLLLVVAVLELPAEDGADGEGEGGGAEAAGAVEVQGEGGGGGVPGHDRGAVGPGIAADPD